MYSEFEGIVYILGIFTVLAVGIPVVLTAAGVTLGILHFLFGLAVFLIKVAVVVAVGHLILVGIRAFAPLIHLGIQSWRPYVFELRQRTAIAEQTPRDRIALFSMRSLCF